MFFLKELPSRAMIAGYAERLHADPDAIAAGLAMMRRASLLIRRLDRYFDGHGLSQLRFLFLIVIDREPERDSLTVGEIADRLDVAGPIVARTLRLLIEDGLVRARRDGGDARVKHIGLTGRGRALLGRVLPGYFAIIEEDMARASP